MLMHQLHVVARNRPSALAEMGKILGDAGINIEGIAAFDLGARANAEIDLLVADPSAARRALNSGGFEIEDEYDVVIAQLENRVGAFANCTRALAEQGVEVQFMYGVTDNRVVIGTEQAEAVDQIVSRLGS